MAEDNVAMGREGDLRVQGCVLIGRVFLGEVVPLHILGFLSSVLQVIQPW